MMPLHHHRRREAWGAPSLIPPKSFPCPKSDFTRSGARADIESAVGFRILNDMYERLVDDLFEAAAERAMMKDAGYQGLVDLVTIFADGGKPTFTGVLGTAAGGAAGYLLVAALYTNPATGLLATGFALGTMVSGTLLTMQGTINTRDAAIEQGTSLIQSQLDPLTSDRNRYVNSFSTTQAVESKDPNDIIGPEGFGEERWIGITQPLEYKIRYENDPELASAPAQIVRIVHPLDETADIRAFRLGTFGFCGYHVLRTRQCVDLQRTARPSRVHGIVCRRGGGNRRAEPGGHLAVSLH